MKSKVGISLQWDSISTQELVAEAVAELEGGEPLEVPKEVRIDLPVDAHLPRRLRE